MSVVNHKTATEGVAKVMMKDLDQARVAQYVDTVRQVQDITRKCPNLFVLTGSRPIVNLSPKLKQVG